MTHTPGPWEAVLDDDPRGQPVAYYRGIVAFVERSPDRTIAVVAESVECVNKSEWDGNARLIAAAPTMLGALRKILPTLPAHPDGCTWCPRCEAERAIRDAEGEA